MGRISDEDSGLSMYMTAIERFAPLDREEEQSLARAWQATQDPVYAHRLVNANLRFVVRMALRYRGYGIRVADLVEEGNVGLLEAVKRFDPDRNLRFMTYASYWARAYILAHVLKQSTLVGVGTGPLQSKLFFRLARERARITSALGEHASQEQIEQHLATKFETTPERIREIAARLDARDVSLDAPVFDDGPSTGMDVLPDTHSDTERDLANKRRDEAVREKLHRLMRTLPERERYIVDHRLLADEEETLADIGRHLSLSRERVRQLEERLKGKLRDALAEWRPIAA